MHGRVRWAPRGSVRHRGDGRRGRCNCRTRCPAPHLERTRRGFRRVLRFLAGLSGRGGRPASTAHRVVRAMSPPRSDGRPRDPAAGRLRRLWPQLRPGRRAPWPPFPARVLRGVRPWQLSVLACSRIPSASCMRRRRFALLAAMTKPAMTAMATSAAITIQTILLVLMMSSVGRSVCGCASAVSTGSPYSTEIKQKELRSVALGLATPQQSENLRSCRSVS